MKSARNTLTFMYKGRIASQNLATEVHAGGKGRKSVCAKKNYCSLSWIPMREQKLLGLVCFSQVRLWRSTLMDIQAPSQSEPNNEYLSPASFEQPVKSVFTVSKRAGGGNWMGWDILWVRELAGWQLRRWKGMALTLLSPARQLEHCLHSNTQILIFKD